VLLANIVVIAAGDQLLLLTPQGELIDHLGSTKGMPDNVQAVGVAGLFCWYWPSAEPGISSSANEDSKAMRGNTSRPRYRRFCCQGSSTN
jgi:hypothetical protein